MIKAETIIVSGVEGNYTLQIFESNQDYKRDKPAAEENYKDWCDAGFAVGEWLQSKEVEEKATT